MFNGIRLFSSDPVWRHILGDLGAVVLDTPDVSALDFDALGMKLPVDMEQLRAAVFVALDNSRIVNDIVGSNVTLSPLQEQIVAILHKSGGMSATDIRTALGYSPDVTTHAVDTAIYGLRKMCGHDFIINSDGIYKIGHV